MALQRTRQGRAPCSAQQGIDSYHDKSLARHMRLTASPSVNIVYTYNNYVVTILNTSHSVPIPGRLREERTKEEQHAAWQARNACKHPAQFGVPSSAVRRAIEHPFPNSIRLCLFAKYAVLLNAIPMFTFVPRVPFTTAASAFFRRLLLRTPVGVLAYSLFEVRPRFFATAVANNSNISLHQCGGLELPVCATQPTRRTEKGCYRAGLDWTGLG